MFRRSRATGWRPLHGGLALSALARSPLRVLRRVAALAFVGVLAVPGIALASCPTQPVSNPFSQWGDNNNYFLAPGGSFEGTTDQVGWTLSGASLTQGNEPFYVDSSSDSQSLTISGGGSAISPFFCVDNTMGSLRFFAQQIEAGGGPGGRFKGIRYISATHPDQSAWGSPVLRPEGMLVDPKVREGFAALGNLGLTFDAWCYHTQLVELIDLARAFPAQKIVLDHVGGAIGLGRYKGKRDEVFAEWSGRIKELASCPNVHIKLGGLGMRMFGFDVHEQAEPPPSETLAGLWRPYIETCVAAFGPDRAMFESNFPPDKGQCSYQVIFNAFKRIAASMSETEKDALFSKTAMKVYRLELA